MREWLQQQARKVGHPWRWWHGAGRAVREGHYVRFEMPLPEDADGTMFGSERPEAHSWILRWLPHAFDFSDVEDERFSTQEIIEYMAEHATDWWTMGWFEPRFQEWYVFIRDDDDAFAFRMRFQAKYVKTRDADYIVRMFSIARHVITSLKVRL